jgi:hypothetical protein
VTDSTGSALPGAAVLVIPKVIPYDRLGQFTIKYGRALFYQSPTPQTFLTKAGYPELRCRQSSADLDQKYIQIEFKLREETPLQPTTISDQKKLIKDLETRIVCPEERIFLLTTRFQCSKVLRRTRSKIALSRISRGRQNRPSAVFD